MRVTVCYRLADAAVFRYAYKVHAPCVYSDAGDIEVLLLRRLQALDNLEVQCIDIPVEVSVHLYQVIVKTRQFLQFYLAIVKSSDDGASACRPEVHGKEILFFHSVI